MDTLTVRFMRNHGKQLIARVGSVLDVEDANNLKGKMLFIERSALPDLCPDEFYYSDLVSKQFSSKHKKIIINVKSADSI